ncbi:MAG: hypothetical protein SNF93_02260 [Rikenellaceae bacterium]
MKNLKILTLFALVFSGCSQPTQWAQEQRVEFISSLNPYRQMAYLNELDDAEFVVFTSDVSADIESAYPVYTQFVMMPSLSDTVDMWIVGAIVDQLDADASNMRYLYPYHTLVAQGILPAGLDRAARLSFYRCFAQKINNKFMTLESFFYAVITNDIDPNEITTMQRDCASELFNFTVVAQAVRVW